MLWQRPVGTVRSRTEDQERLSQGVSRPSLHRSSTDQRLLLEDQQVNISFCSFGSRFSGPGAALKISVKQSSSTASPSQYSIQLNNISSIFSLRRAGSLLGHGGVVTLRPSIATMKSVQDAVSLANGGVVG